jgi:hypothetical protein
VGGLEGTREGRKRYLEIDDIASGRLDCVGLEDGVLRGALSWGAKRGMSVGGALTMERTLEIIGKWHPQLET